MTSMPQGATNWASTHGKRPTYRHSPARSGQRPGEAPVTQIISSTAAAGPGSATVTTSEVVWLKTFPSIPL